MDNENLLNQMYRPDDKLGIELFGAVPWSMMKGRVCGLTNYALTNPVSLPVKRGACSPLFFALFNPDVQVCDQMLGKSIIEWIDEKTTSSDWWNKWIKVKDAGETVASFIPIAAPFVSAGQKVNSAISAVWDAIRGKKTDDTTSTTTKVVWTVGTVLVVGGIGYGIYRLGTRKSRKRRRR